MNVQEYYVGRIHPLKWLRQTDRAEFTLFMLIIVAQALFGWMLYNSKVRARSTAEQAGASIVKLLAAAIQQKANNFQHSLDGTVAALSVPGVWEVAPQIRQMALFDASIRDVDFSAMIITDHTGKLLANSADALPGGSVADRDYFRYHQTHLDTGPHFSGPLVSLINGRPVIIVSRRVNNSDGTFAGVVAGGIFLSYVQELLEKLNPGDTGALGLFRSDGILLARVPYEPRAVGMDLAKGSLFRHLSEASYGTYVDQAAFDGVERLVTFQKLRDLPFIVSYSRNTSFVFSAWNRMAWAVAATALVLWVAKLAQLWRLRRERTSRLAAERLAAESVLALAVANDDLEERVLREVAAREEVSEKLARGQRLDAIGQLAGGIAHDINNVLQTVSGACSLLQDRADRPTEVERLISVALAATDRGSSITQRLLAFARRDQLRAESIEPTALLTDMRGLLNHTLGGGVVVKLELAKDLPKLVADRMQLETVLINLATNARDAMPGGSGTIIISACLETIGIDAASPNGLPSGDFIRISVGDSGIGMDARTIARAIEPFFTTKGVGKGSGLGLSMAKGFAEQSGGALDITSQRGAGTTVTIWLPVLNDQRVILATKSGSAPIDTVPASAQSVAVLVVDDEEPIRLLVSDWLTNKGFAVTSAASAQEAIALLADGLSVDLLLTDLSMPEMSGIELVRAARQKQRGDLPAIIFTGNLGAASSAIDT